jgi:hypothetical protein
MTVEADGIQEALEGGLRVGLTAAGRAGELLAAGLQRQLAEVRARGEQEARLLAQRLHVERTAARAQLAPTTEGTWWDRASAREIVQAHTTATAWRDIDPDANRAAERIAEEVRRRYGIDVDATPDRAELEARARRTHEAVVRADEGQTPPWERLTDVQRESAIEAQEYRAAAPRATAEFLEAKMLMDIAERLDKDADAQRAAAQDTRADPVREDGLDLYDTAERRQVLAQELEDKGIDSAVIATRVRADVSQAKPATEATRVTSSTSPKARRTRGGQSHQLQHTGLGK